MKCRILADHHEFGRKSQEVIPEKPKMCLKSPRVTVVACPASQPVSNMCPIRGPPRRRVAG